MCLAVLEEILVTSEGSLIVPKVLTDNVQHVGPLGQITCGAMSARRITQSNNPIVWGVEGVDIILNISGNFTASKILRIAAVGTTSVACWISPNSLVGMVALSLTNSLLEEEIGG